MSDGVRSGPAVGQHACYVPASGAGNGRVISRKQGERPVARQRVGRGSGVVFGGDSGGGFLAEADVGAEAGQVLVAALGLEFGCGFRCRALRVPRPPGSERGALVAGSMKALGRKTVARLRIDRTSASILMYYVTR